MRYFVYDVVYPLSCSFVKEVGEEEFCHADEGRSVIVDVLARKLYYRGSWQSIPVYEKEVSE